MHGSSPEVPPDESLEVMTVLGRMMFSIAVLSSVALGQGGAPSFSQAASSPVLISTSSPHYDIAVVDVTADGRPDVLVSGLSGIEIFAQGTGVSFSAPGSLLGDSPTVTFHQVNDFKVRDIGTDGVPDIVALDNPGDIGVWVGQSTGGFGGVTKIPANLPSSFLVDVFDMDGDDHADIVVGTEQYLNDGSGSFGSAISLPSLYTCYGPQGLDIDGDGDLDIAGRTEDSVVEIFLNDGSGSFSLDHNEALDSNQTGQREALGVGDLDLDGHTDLLAGSSGGLYSVGLNDGSGNFAFPTSTPPILPSAVYSPFTTLGPAFNKPFLTDMNGDLIPDLVLNSSAYTGNSSIAQAVVARGDGSGAFSNFTRLDGTTLAQPTPNVQAWACAVGDLDGDFDGDVVFPESGPTPRLRVFMNNVNWTDLGHSKPGASGPPVFTATGSLGAAYTLSLVNAKPNAPALFFLNASVGGPQTGGYYGFQGGTIVPDYLASPPPGYFAITIPSTGTIIASASNSVPATYNTWVYMQYFIRESTSPQVWSASNALLNVVP